MKKLGIFLISIIFIFQTNLYPYSSDPKMFVEELVNEAINKLSDKDLTIDEKYKFIEKIALENVDINALGLYTLGELRKSSEKKDIIKYQKTFEKYFLKSLTSRLSDYSSSFENNIFISLLFELRIEANSSFWVLARLNPSTIKSLIKGLSGFFV
jgi:phospholipid transport system substrate-binding protein